MGDAFDFIVIGGGPGGTEAALRAASAGLKTALIEKDELGGVCLNAGCIPLKSLLNASAAFHSAKIQGFCPPPAPTVWEKMLQTKKQVVQRLRSALEAKLVAAGVVIIHGMASFRSATEIAVVTANGQQLICGGKNVLVATGAVPVLPAGWNWGKRVLDTAAALRLENLPASIAIAGGGVSGCEFATLFAEMGIKTTLLEASPCLLPGMDVELGRFAARKLSEKGVRVLTGMRVDSIEELPSEVEFSTNAASGHAEFMVVALGRKANSSGLDLANAGLTVASTDGIEVDAGCRTSSASVYAAGDVIGGPMLAHVAEDGAHRVVASILGKSQPSQSRVLSQCVFTHPEIATAGTTEGDCRARGIPVRVFKASNLANGYAHAVGETSGFVKIVADFGTGRMLGVQIAGASASAIVGEATLAIGAGMKVQEFVEVMRPHPSFQETFGLASEFPVRKK